MSEIELNNTKNLLNHVRLITKKYDDLAEYTGENYNIFNVLNIYNNELSHSAVIGNLLNAKGKHGQKDVFLKLFLEEISKFEDESVQHKVLESFDKMNSEVVIEKYIGKVNHEIGEGGRIDILITDGKNNIIIENKIWAGDQHQQLLRYNNFDKNAPIIYLTLDNKDASDSSKDTLLLGKEFVCMSYRENICNWLESCIKEMANKPIIRESLNQYLVLVKQLTNQATNDKMKEEIIDLIFKNNSNFEIAKMISNSLSSVQNNLINKLKRIVEIGKKDNMFLDKEMEINNHLYFLKIIPLFTYNGFKLIRFDIILNENKAINDFIMIEIILNNYKLENKIQSNNPAINYKLSNELQDTLNIVYDYKLSDEEIFEKIKVIIQLILSRIY